MASRKQFNKDSQHRLNELNNNIGELLKHISDPSFDLEGWKGFPKETKSIDVPEEPVNLLQENITALIHYFRNRTSDFQEMAIKDQLTGLYNRHFFNEVIKREANRIERTGDVISFIMLDMDDLKYINDTLGHLAGDKIIIEGAGLLQQNVRKSDLVFRFGGDEFLVLLVDTDCDGTDYMIRRFLAAVDTWNTNNADGYGCKLSFSIGCSTCKNCGEVLETLSEADKRMYSNKKKKKDSVMLPKQSPHLN